MRELGAGKPGATNDQGFTLIEVVVALVLLGMVATGALYFFITGTQTTSHFQRSQNAVAIANEAMERAYAISPRDNAAVGAPGLVLARWKPDVDAAFAAAMSAGVEGVDATYPLWDPTADTDTEPVVPITYTRKYSGIEYDVTILIGSCFRDRTVLDPDQPCTRLPGVAADPGDSGTPAGKVRMLRVIANVDWAPTAGTCAADTCSYQLAGLVDRSSDLEWNQVIDPVAADDFATVEHGTTGELKVLVNDVVGPVGSSPVQIVTSPALGTATVAANGTVSYTPKPEFSGQDIFTYRIKDARGAQSVPANITITIPPKAVNDGPFDVYHGQATVLPVLANDLGRSSAQSIQIVGNPSRGSVTVSGTEVRYTPNVTSGLDSFRYQFTDASGQVTDPPATVNVRIDAVSAADRTVPVAARSVSSDVWTDVTAILKAGNANPNRIDIKISGLSSGAFRVDGTRYTSGTRTGTVVEFSPPRNSIGEFTFDYQLVTESGYETPVRRLTIQVLPVAVNDALSGNQKHDRTIYVAVRGNDVPSSASMVDVRTGAVAAWCGRFHDTQNRLSSGEIRLTLPALGSRESSRDCSFTYTTAGRGSLSHLVSAPATVTYRVTK